MTLIVHACNQTNGRVPNGGRIVLGSRSCDCERWADRDAEAGNLDVDGWRKWLFIATYPWSLRCITSKHVSPKHIHLDLTPPLTHRVSLLTQSNHPISRSQPPRLDLPSPYRAKFLPLRPSDPDDQNLFSRYPNFQLPPKLTILPTLTHSHILLVSTTIPLDSTTSSPAQSSPQRERRPSQCHTHTRIAP